MQIGNELVALMLQQTVRKVKLKQLMESGNVLKLIIS